jgi:hypothetical protein
VTRRSSYSSAVSRVTCARPDAAIRVIQPMSRGALGEARSGDGALCPRLALDEGVRTRGHPMPSTRVHGVVQVRRLTLEMPGCCFSSG